MLAKICSGPRVMDEAFWPIGGSSLPLEDYDELTVQEMSKKLEDLIEQEVRAIRSYEKRHKNRETLLERLDRALI